MSIYNGAPNYGVVNNPLVDSPYVQIQEERISDFPVNNVLLETDGTPLLLTTGQFLDLA